jgi:hypothetical protein
MKLRFTIYFVLTSFFIHAQTAILSDPRIMEEIEIELNRLYNFNFDSASQFENKLETSYPESPLPPLFKATKMYWQYFPITPNSPYHNAFVQSINLSIGKSENILSNDKNNSEAAFLNLMARLLIMQYYSDNHESSLVLPHVRRAYAMVRKGFDLTHTITDFNFSTGLYNYYREAYPEKHPIYKPVAYFFRKGDKDLGLKQLEYNWKHGVFLDAESLSFLVFISLNFEENYKKSARYTRELYKAYPDNPLYLSYRIRTLLLLERYHRAEQLIDELESKSAENDFFRMMINIYRGIMEEKKNKNPEFAEKLYLEAIELGKNFQPFANDRISYACFGLSRIYEHKNPKKSKEYLELAKSLSSYKHLNFD